jgi:hypothetical protein
MIFHTAPVNGMVHNGMSRLSMVPGSLNGWVLAEELDIIISLFVYQFV